MEEVKVREMKCLWWTQVKKEMPKMKKILINELTDRVIATPH